MLELQKNIKDVFEDAFGRTPLRQRLDDIFGEAVELKNCTDLQNLREELGDLLSSSVMLCNEAGWDVEDLISENLEKIERRKKQYKSLGRKVKVALLGGAFDPPTLGHFQLAQFVLDTSKSFDEVWFVPCYQHLYGKKMVSAEHRLAMCEEMCKKDGRMKVFSYEIDNELAGETYHFIKHLLDEEYAKDKYEFSIIIGMDNANTFDKWVNYEDLVKMIPFVVVSRQGVDVDPCVDWYLHPPHIYLRAERAIINVSSTHCRYLIKDMSMGTLCNYMVDEVVKYIKDNDLYIT